MKRLLTSVLFVVLIMAAGCGSRGEKDETADAGAPPATEIPTDESTTVDSPPTPPPAQEADAPAGQESAQQMTQAVQTVEEAGNINSYRMHVTTKSESARGVDSAEIDGMYVKEPPAEKVVITFMEGDLPQSMQMVAVDGMRYMQNEDMWIQTPDMIFSTDELTLITPEDVANLTDSMSYVGVESVNGREADHYVGDRDMIPVVGTEGDTLDVSEIEFAQLDLWIDRTDGIVVKLLMEATDSGDDGPTTMSVLIEYSDFNSEFLIEAPDMGSVDAGSASEAPAAGAPTTDLGRVLGFDLLLPTGSTIQMAAGDMLLVAATPYTVEEAEQWIALNLPANGYAQMAKIGPVDDQITFMFQNESKMVTVTISKGEDGMAVVQFAATPM